LACRLLETCLDRSDDLTLVRARASARTGVTLLIFTGVVATAGGTSIAKTDRLEFLARLLAEGEPVVAAAARAVIAATCGQEQGSQTSNDDQPSENIHGSVSS
jgi:hypothetical protein